MVMTSCFLRKVSQNSKENTCVGVSYKLYRQLYKKGDSGTDFLGKFGEIFKNIYFLEHLQTAVSETSRMPWINTILEDESR